MATKNEEVSTEESRAETFVNLPLKGGAALRKRLKWTHDSHYHTHPPTTSDPKGYYLYGVLNEVEKAVLSVMQAYEFIKDSRKQGEPTLTDDDGKRIADNVIQSRIDELALWQRKMTELIVELQGFKGCNSEDYYRAYLIVSELAGVRRSKEDLKEYYGANNKNYAYQENELLQQLAGLTPKLQVAKCWFVKANNGNIGSGQTNFDTRFKALFKKMKPPLRALLRTQYLSFGNQSKSIHASVAAGERQLGLDNMDAHAGRVATLAIHVVVMAQDLMHIHNTKGWLKACADIVKKNDYPLELHKQRTRADLVIGDFVIVNGSLAQVVKVKISKGYRYKSFRVRYLLESPLPNTPEDEVPGDWVRILYKRQPLVKQTIVALLAINPNAKPTTREINRLLRNGVVAGWENGLRERVLGLQPRDGTNFDEYKAEAKKLYDKAMAAYQADLASSSSANLSAKVGE